MGHREILYFYVVISTFLRMSNGCTIDGIPSWLFPETRRILDTHDGIIYSSTTTDIVDISRVNHREGLNKGPYVNVVHENSELIISTNNDYRDYEEQETEQAMGFTVIFNCIDGTTRNLVFVIDITDTNNNDPQFLPSNTFEFTLAPPIPPNYLITNCVQDIIVRDIDLTTVRIDFALQGNTLFEIGYDNTSSVPKEFKAILKTTAFIRSIPQPISFTITATDVDATGDPPRTTTATVKISADTEFGMPEEPIFSRPFYMANYTTDNGIILQDTIYLRQGFDDQVKFTFEGQFSDYFALIANENEIKFSVITQLPTEVYQQREIYLVVKAEREYTSGGDAVVILALPGARELSFEKPSYSGTLDGNVITLEDIVLSFGFSADVTFNLTGHYANYFTLNNIQNRVLIEIQGQLPIDEVSNENNFLVLDLSASGINAITSTTTIFLEIIKEDTVTPVFSQKIYNGVYLNNDVNFQNISLFQGYDDTVTFNLVGDQAQYFSLEKSSNNIMVALNSPIPENLIFDEKVFVFNLVAEKQRTVGGNTAIALKFPTELTEPTIMKFAKNTYSGLLEDGKLIVEDIVLELGFTLQTKFMLHGNYSESFTITNSNNIVTIDISDTVSIEELEKNRHIILEIEATRERAVPSTTSVFIYVPEKVIVFPVFEKTLYKGSYTIEGGLVFTEAMSLNLGFDSTVTFSLEGENSEWFSLIHNDDLVTLITNETNSLTQNILDQNAYLSFNVVANKPETIGGRSAVYIDLPNAQYFDQVLYHGKLQDNIMTHDTITLSGYNEPNILLTGEYAYLFEPSLLNGVVTIHTSSAVIIPANLTHIALTLQAGSATAVLLLEVANSGTEPAVTVTFDKLLYSGKVENGIVSHETITVTGYDGQSVQIVGEYASSFEANLSNGEVTVHVALSAVIPPNLTHIALTLQVGSANAVLLLDVASSGSEPEVSVTFDKVLYSGKVDNGIVSHDTITVTGYDGQSVQIVGEYASSFEANLSNREVTVHTASSAVIPPNLTHIALTLQAGSASAVLLLDVASSGSEPGVSVTFDKVLYSGKVDNGIVSHDTITVTGYDGQSVQIVGEYASSFEANLSNGEVTVHTASSAVIPPNLTHIALTLQAGSASAVLLLDVASSGSEPEVSVTFDKVLYSGKVDNGIVSHDTITVTGYDGQSVQIVGEYASSFEANLSNGEVTVHTASSAVIPPNLTHIALTLQAGSASAVLLLDVASSGSEPGVSVTFDKVLYSGKVDNGIVSHDTITVTGYDGQSVQIVGEYASSFEANLSNGEITVHLALSAVIPPNLTHIALTLQAGSANAVLLLDVASSGSEPGVSVTFDKVLYSGKVDNGIVSHDTITVTGYDGQSVQIVGEYASSFEANLSNGEVTVHTASSAVIPPNLTHIALTLQAGSANAVLLLDVASSGSEPGVSVTFDKVLYSGKVDNGIVSHDTITVTGYDGQSVQIVGEYASSFEANLSNGEVTVHTASSAVIPPNLTHIALTLQAGSANAVLLLDVASSGSEPGVSVTFDKVLYNGKVDNGIVSHDTITVTGYDGQSVQIVGEYASSFEANLSNGEVTVHVALSAVIPPNLTHIALTLQAGSASAVLLLDVASSGSDPETIAFDKVLYSGKLENEIVTHETITVTGYDGQLIQIVGQYASSFEADLTNEIVTVRTAPSAVFPGDLTHIDLTLQAGRASAVLLIDVANSGNTGTEVAFDKVLYNGKLDNGFVAHDTITLSGYSGANIQIAGEYASSFEGSSLNGVVTIRTTTPSAFPTNLTHLALTLHAGGANAVLLLDIVISGSSEPTVTFSETSYLLWADVDQTGVIGRVKATANNGEAISYSLSIDDVQLRERISVSNEGEIILSAAVQSGAHSFIVTATAQNSQAEATASVLLRVEALPECEASVGLPPLIVLERLEEEPHRNLVVLNRTEHPNCRYNLSNSWPADQLWLYVDEEGLHAAAIDREHESIAFMTLSQIQVELILYCDSDEVPVAKRSLNAEQLEIGPNEYGSNKWVLADTIEYDARRSFVNLIVIDINDNRPIFIGKESEPIYVGYPIPDLEDTILPRALAEVKATDADIGENAALVYWSPEDNLAVAPQTGSVHVRNIDTLEDNSHFTVYATDQYGRGLNGSLEFVVKLLESNQIAVLTVRNAFLDDESTILSNLSTAVGYELKVLRTAIISENNEETTRKKREVVNSPAASLQLYVYGLRENVPVNVVQLTSDISNSNVVAVNVARILSLEDHLESLEICPVPERDIGFFVATIVLAAVLFILIVGIAVWFILFSKYRINLKWRKNYEQFSDSNSVGSRTNRIEQLPKVEIAKSRLNIDELKRSERRLQEMLEIPIREVPMEPDNGVNYFNDTTPNGTTSKETIVDVATPAPIQLPIVIQSIDKLKDSNDDSDDEDEFGEKSQKSRKSVVTFNENVEKIIHLEDNFESTPEPNFENDSETNFVYKL